jgi:hypothetical protein
MRGKCQFQHQRDLEGQIPSCDGCQPLPIEAGDSLFSMCRGNAGLPKEVGLCPYVQEESNHCDLFFFLCEVVYETR